MKAASKYLQPLRLPGVFNVLELNESHEILAASMVACHMLWPELKEERSRSMYMTLCLRKVHDVLLETEKDQAQTQFTYLEAFHGDSPWALCPVDGSFALPSKRRSPLLSRGNCQIKSRLLQFRQLYDDRLGQT